jgi:hypothetical protein
VVGKVNARPAGSADSTDAPLPLVSVALAVVLLVVMVGLMILVLEDVFKVVPG